jgi:hypothetical protein
MKNQACSSYNRLSKKTFLSLLGNKAFQKPSGYSDLQDYVYKGKNTKIKANEDYSANRTRRYFEKMDYNSWSIVSFDPNSREVCVQIQTKSGFRNLSVTLPLPALKGA